MSRIETVVKKAMHDKFILGVWVFSKGRPKNHWPYCQENKKVHCADKASVHKVMELYVFEFYMIISLVGLSTEWIKPNYSW